MAFVALKIKIMPESPNTDLKDIEKKAEEKIKKLNASIHKFEIEDIAYGLKALILTLIWPEEKETSLAEDALQKIEGVSSLQIVDYRRAIG